ncbi:hypothetical protein A2716_01170 [candidate division WWE3 bacterium RIFCSPHIGHO2_01_FULL_40_23]|uniref:DUF2062 domain-containing protein n=1 Tax=candidate division WWE3 bacterium RIFCSPLOWO2_01_FULL_41_18 TaxID=1802625 RepID=A0A1F4VFV5_UNCKA|nr:MAG: hypothetical protein A2716_01170 [candidate division WWE3 bacterium RIFCSPHIGHO2_01_FULL_40_23]OGC55583.1 MAG: hypothetical protein A3A78_00075 [candidate division WWE3 bacterium RIFCSPLOWO2_01_FULL_41_18]
MRHEPIVTANAAAATTGIVFVACRILVGLFPELMFNVAQSWFHGIGFSRFDSSNLTVSSLVLGLVSSVLTVWVIAYLFAQFYNYFLKNK